MRPQCCRRAEPTSSRSTCSRSVAGRRRCRRRGRSRCRPAPAMPAAIGWSSPSATRLRLESAQLVTRERPRPSGSMPSNMPAPSPASAARCRPGTQLRMVLIAEGRDDEALAVGSQVMPLGRLPARTCTRWSPSVPRSCRSRRARVCSVAPGAEVETGVGDVKTVRASGDVVEEFGARHRDAGDGAPVFRLNPRTRRCRRPRGCRPRSLDAPKGMAIVGDTLWVADIDAVRGFNRKTGGPSPASRSRAPSSSTTSPPARTGSTSPIPASTSAPAARMSHPGPDRVFRIAGRKVASGDRVQARGRAQRHYLGLDRVAPGDAPMGEAPSWAGTRATAAPQHAGNGASDDGRHRAAGRGALSGHLVGRLEPRRVREREDRRIASGIAAPADSASTAPEAGRGTPIDREHDGAARRRLRPGGH